MQAARELQADLGEHLAVATRDGVAGELEGIEGRVQGGHQAAQRRVTPEQATADERAPERVPIERRVDGLQLAVLQVDRDHPLDVL